MKALDLTGKKFGFLEAKEFIQVNKKRAYKCLCECGSEVIRTVSQLRAGGKYQSCGCKSNLIYVSLYNLEGQEINGVLILKRLDSNKKLKTVNYKCKCLSCNNEFISNAKYLKIRPDPCGCKFLQRGKSHLLPGEALCNRVIEYYKRNASTRNLVFELTNEECKLLFFNNCYYCNVEPSLKIEGYGLLGSFIYNGIDRLNNNIGYIANNVVSCCTFCNKTKKDTNVDDFLKWRVYNNRVCHE